MRAHPDVNYRYLFLQKNPIGGVEEILFGNDTTWVLQEQGRLDGENAIKAGEGVGF
jgi:hypothetical protein